MRKRGHYDRATIDAILDEGILCHVGFVHEGAPVVIPTLYWREGDYVYLHGSAASRMLGTLDRRADLRDGDAPRRPRARRARPSTIPPTTARSSSSASRRKSRTRARREARMRIFMEGLFPGRWDDAAAGQAQGTEGDAPAAACASTRLGEDPLRPAGRRRGGLHLAGLGRDHPAFDTRVGTPQPDEHAAHAVHQPPKLLKFRSR